MALKAESISIIIPTYNEAELIGTLLEWLRLNSPRAEIIVADCGSDDGTAQASEPLASRVVFSRKGRAWQMNAGAREASGNILWFLHADCWPPPNAINLIFDSMKDPKVVGGGFRWGLKGGKWYYKPLAAMAHVKNKLRRNLFGDMGIFVRRTVFERLHGYAEIPLCEEVEFNRRLKKIGKTVIRNEVLLSSDRRLLQQGPIRAFIKNHIIKTAFILGISPDTLKKYY